MGLSHGTISQRFSRCRHGRGNVRRPNRATHTRNISECGDISLCVGNPTVSHLYSTDALKDLETPLLRLDLSSHPEDLSSRSRPLMPFQHILFPASRRTGPATTSFLLFVLSARFCIVDATFACSEALQDHGGYVAVPSPLKDKGKTTSAAIERNITVEAWAYRRELFTIA